MDDIQKEIIKAKRKEAKLPNNIKEAQRKVFMDAWFKCEGVTNECARYLGIHRVQVWRYRKRYGLL